MEILWEWLTAYIFPRSLVSHNILDIEIAFLLEVLPGLWRLDTKIAFWAENLESAREILFTSSCRISAEEWFWKTFFQEELSSSKGISKNQNLKGGWVGWLVYLFGEFFVLAWNTIFSIIHSSFG